MVTGVVLVPLLLPLKRIHTLFWCFHCWLWTGKYHLGHSHRVQKYSGIVVHRCSPEKLCGKHHKFSHVGEKILHEEANITPVSESIMELFFKELPKNLLSIKHLFPLTFPTGYLLVLSFLFSQVYPLVFTSSSEYIEIDIELTMHL